MFLQRNEHCSALVCANLDAEGKKKTQAAKVLAAANRVN